MKRNLVATLFTAAALTGCAGANGGSVEPSAQPSTSAAAASSTPAPNGPPLCSDLFVEGQPIDYEAAKGGCSGPDGMLYAASAFSCNDGTHLWQIEAKTGALNGYGFDDQPYIVVEGDTASDKDYAKAYAKCNG